MGSHAVRTGRHPIIRFQEPVLGGHDRRQFEMYCFSDGGFNQAQSGLPEIGRVEWRHTAGRTNSNEAAMVPQDLIEPYWRLAD